MFILSSTLFPHRNVILNHLLLKSQMYRAGRAVLILASDSPADLELES